MVSGLQVAVQTAPGASSRNTIAADDAAAAARRNNSGPTRYFISFHFGHCNMCTAVRTFCTRHEPVSFSIFQYVTVKFTASSDFLFFCEKNLQESSEAFFSPLPYLSTHPPTRWDRVTHRNSLPMCCTNYFERSCHLWEFLS